MTVQRAFLKATQLAAKFNVQLHRELLHPSSVAAGAIHAKKSDTESELWLYDYIAEDGWGGISAQSVVDALKAMKGTKKLTIRINSPGGSVFEAAAILTNLQNFEAEKVVSIEGVAASAATVVAMGGDRIVTAAHATWMIHEASAFAYGRAEDMRGCAELLEKINLTMAEVYARQTGKSVEEMLELMAAETWMTAKEALDKGFTDEIAEPPPKEDDDDDEATARAKATPAIAAALSTDDRLRSVRQARRLEEISARASPANPRPAATNPAAPRKATRP